MQPPALSITVNNPLWVTAQKTPKFTLIYPQDYRHAIKAVGGYWSMSWKVTGNQIEVEDWLADGLGRHVEVYDDALNLCWEGFVNDVSAGIGPLSVTRGPLIDVGNQVYLNYTPIDSSVSPVTYGMQTVAAAINDTDSQDRWGIRVKVVSAGKQTAANAAYIQNAYLDENAEPQTGQSYGGGSGVEATINCLGYWHLLDYPYNQGVNTGTIDISNQDGTGKLQLILAADPNTLFSTDYSGMTNNTIAAPDWEDSYELASAQIKKLVSIGDTTNARYLIGIYGGRKCRYNAAPTDTAYYQYVLDPQQRITTPLGLEVKPWNVLPGRWLFYPDRNVGRTIPASRRLDDRFEFIESVTYNSGGSPAISHVGGKVDNLPQILARLGLAEG